MTTAHKTEWKRVKLGDVTEILSGGTPSSSVSSYWDGDMNWATLPDLKYKYLFKTGRKITSDGLKNSSAKILPINTVIYSSRATLGEISITKVETSTNQGSKNFICNPEKINYEFLYYLLKSKSEKINNHATGATYKEINKTTFSNIEIILPDLATQKCIADVLSVYDDLIENNSKRIQLIENTIQKIFLDKFLKEKVDHNTIEDVAMIHRGKSYSSEDIAEEGKIPFVNLKCINRNGGFRYDGIKSFSGEYKEGNIVRNGDIVIAITDMTQDRAIVARTARIPILEGDFGVISMDLVKIEPKEGISKTWLYSFLRYSNFGTVVKEYANGANVLHLSPVRISEFKLAIPSIDEQQKYSALVEPMLDLQDKLSAENRKLQAIRDILIPRLVSGKIEIK